LIDELPGGSTELGATRTVRSAAGHDKSPLIRLPLMVSARTVARRLRKRRAWVYEMCASGAWPGATRMGGHAWKIPEESVLVWLRHQSEG
jgi:predicted DNA-binding transcriptional regulator AlpA